MITRKNWQHIILTLTIGSGLILIMLTLLISQTNAIRIINGAYGCGAFQEAIALVPDGKTAISMDLPRPSNSALITKGIVIQGGWTEPTQGSDCAGLGATPTITGTAGLRAAGFLFQAPITRSGLIHNNSNPVLRLDLVNKTTFIEHMDLENTAVGEFADRGAGLYGVITDSAYLYMRNVVIHDSPANNYGGGMYLTVDGGSRLLIEDGRFDNNEADYSGGLDLHVYEGSHVTIRDTVFFDNYTRLNGGRGGGVRLTIHGGVVEIENSHFLENGAAQYGGGLYAEMDGGDLIIRNTHFDSNRTNSANSAGGAIYITSIGAAPAAVQLFNTQFSNNLSDGMPNDIETSSSGSGGLTLQVYDQAIYLPLVRSDTASPQAHITGVTIGADWQYEVSFTTNNFTPMLPGQHVHFFFNTVWPEYAGLDPGTGICAPPADDPGQCQWFVYGGSSPFTGYLETNRPPFATHMCILVANPNHSVQLGSGNCYELPVNRP